MHRLTNGLDLFQSVRTLAEENVDLKAKVTIRVISGAEICAARLPARSEPWFHPQFHPQMIYTTNAVESLHRSLRKVIKTRGSFPTSEAAIKLPYLATRTTGVRWRRAIEWTEAMSQFAIVFADRFPGQRADPAIPASPWMKPSRRVIPSPPAKTSTAS